MPKQGGTARPNDPTALILTSLAAEPKHGYALLQDIEEFADVTLGPGTLYGAISRLEGQGLIEPLGAESRRRPYRITAAGSEVLRETISGMEKIVAVGSERLALAPTGGAA